MKKAVILHGTDATPDANWFPWLKQKLEKRGYEVWVPQLPECHTPNRETYNDFLFSSDWDFANNIIIGHSSGAVEVLNLLMDERCPHIKMGVLVSAWATNDAALAPERAAAYKEAGLSQEQFVNLFPPDSFDFEEIRNKADRLAFLHATNDPYCPLEQATFLARNLNAPLTEVPVADHLGTQFPELPELWQILEPNL